MNTGDDARVVDGRPLIRDTWPLGWGDLLRLVGLTVALIAVTTGIGLLLIETFEDSALLRADDRIARWFEDQRTSTLDTATLIGSWLSETLTKVVVTAIIAVLLLRRTRRWLEPLAIALPLIVEAIAFICTTTIVGRDRPAVVQLDESPVSSSFPSGHVAAAVAYGAIAVVLIAEYRSRAVRIATISATIAIPIIVALARMYRGMHHLTDVVAGALLGVASVVGTLALVQRAETLGFLLLSRPGGHQAAAAAAPAVPTMRQGISSGPFRASVQRSVKVVGAVRLPDTTAAVSRLST